MKQGRDYGASLKGSGVEGADVVATGASGDALDKLTAELDRLGPDHVLVHAEELRISFHPGCGCEGPWTVEVVRSPLSRRAVAEPGHGMSLEEAASACAANLVYEGWAL